VSAIQSAASSVQTTQAPPSAVAEALAVGTRVAEFEVRGVLGSGGFGIVYLAWDHALEREVALKEYMPTTLAGRGEGLTVTLRSKSQAETFALGLRSFVNEARMLARFDHPALVKVYRFWEDNGTAYMVMPRYVGRTLRQVRAGMVVPPGEGACRRVLHALLSALEVLHKEGVYHRDIAPDNILLGDDGAPVLLDFGAARRVIGDGGAALTSIMKPHYAPLEQYADQSAMRQGPWTDLYALGGTIYFLLTGREPVPAASRALHDDQPRLSETGSPDCTLGFLAAVDWMLALKPAERPQSVHMMRDVLEGRITLPGRTPERTLPGVAALDGVDILTGPGELNEPAPVSVPSAASHTLVMARPTAPPQTPAESSQAATPAPPAAMASRRTLLPLLALLVVLNIAAWWYFTRPSVPDPAREPVATTVAMPPGAATAPAAIAAATSEPPTVQAAPALQNEAPAETILSVMPARVPRAASAVAASAPGAAATLPGAPTAAGLPAGIATPPTVAAPRAATTATAPLTTAWADPVGPRARCGDRNFISMLVCMKRECEDPALRGHPECVKMREQEEAQIPNSTR
jgi:serine/threonine protein kinase